MAVSGIDSNKLRRAFIEEAEELLEKLDSDLLELENNPEDKDLINEIFRVMHSLKSESAVVGFSSLSNLAHKLEDVFEKLRSGEMSLEQSKMDLILGAVDAVHEMIASIAKGGHGEEIDITEILDELKLLCGETVTSRLESKTLGETKKKQIAIEKIWEFSEFELNQLKEAMERNERFYRLTCTVDPESPMKYARAFLVFTNLEQVVNVIKTIPPFDREVEEDDSYGELVVYLTTSGDDRDIYRATEVDEIQKVELIKLSYDDFLKGGDVKREIRETAEKKAKPRRIEKSSIRIETRKIDELWRLVGELVINKSQIEKLMKNVLSNGMAGELGEYIESAIDSLDKISEGIQQAIMETRMVPIAVIFNKLPRLVRDLSRKLGKQVKLEVSGEETEIDRSIVEALSEPITHLIRNALDHGIEYPEERIARGKAVEGIIKVSAYQEGGNIILQIEDDGKGFDTERIREVAMAKGMIGEEEISENELLKVVFNPGFSTKEEITELSGRGVGMDVVANKIKEQLKGDVNLHTVKGRGTRITIMLPLTLTILQAVIVESGGKYYAIPVRRTEETVEIVNTELIYEAEKTLYNYRGKNIPVIYFDKLLGKRAGKSEDNYGVIISHGNRIACLIVDRLIEEQDIVIKPIDDILNENHIFSGVSILGDGKIVYILDTSTILELS